MREHAIPQDVTGYRFHIVGNMTLKQFAEVALGFVVAIILYKTNLIPIVKWPLILLSAGSGALIAFVPIEERPLDHWLTTFFGILYRPTQFFWRKKITIPEPFLYKPDPQAVITPSEIDLSPARRQRIQEYLTSVRPSVKLDPWEMEQKSRAAQLLQQFSSIEVESVTISQKTQRPNLQVRVRELQSTEAMTSLIPDAVVVPTEVTVFEQPLEAVPENSAVLSVDGETETPPESSANLPTADNAPEAVVEETPVEPAAENNPAETPTQLMQNKSVIAEAEDVANQIMVPIATNTQVDTAAVQSEEDTPSNSTQQSSAQLISSSAQTVFMMNASSQLNESQQATASAVHRSDLPFPNRPTVPNKVVGMVFTPEGKILPGAIVEIRNMNGEVARAVKTNPLGQFFITTPLDSGQYIIVTEKTGYSFANQQLTLDSTIIDPVQIVSQA